MWSRSATVWRVLVERAASWFWAVPQPGLFAQG
jgi:hypothetical protein